MTGSGEEWIGDCSNAPAPGCERDGETETERKREGDMKGKGKGKGKRKENEKGTRKGREWKGDGERRKTDASVPKQRCSLTFGCCLDRPDGARGASYPQLDLTREQLMGNGNRIAPPKVGDGPRE